MSEAQVITGLVAGYLVVGVCLGAVWLANDEDAPEPFVCLTIALWPLVVGVWLVVCVAAVLLVISMALSEVFRCVARAWRGDE